MPFQKFTADFICCSSLFLFLFSFKSVTAGVTAYVGLGSDSTCTHQSIQAAIDDVHQYSDILVAAGPANNRIVYNEDLTITRPIVFTGGYTTCDDMVAGNIFIDSPRALLIGTGSGPVIEINNSTGADFYKFEITGGHGVSGGGIESRNSRTRLFNSFVHSNSSNSYGGGIYSYNDTLNTLTTQLQLGDTLVVSNQAVLGGGGIYAQNTHLRGDEYTGISFNQVTHSNGDGGGLYLFNGKLDFYGGIDEEPNPINLYTYWGISHNSTPRHGGGIYAISSTLNLLGSEYSVGLGVDVTPLNINNNTADSDNDSVGNGGGIYARGSFLSPSYVELHRAKVNHNSAHQGGGFYLGENTTMKMRRTRDSNQDLGSDVCWSTNCSVLQHNKASFKGGAVFAEQGAHITVSQTHITDNRSDYGTVLYVDSTNSSNDIVFDQNLVVHNGRGGAGEFADFNAFNLYNNSSIVSDDNLSFLIRHNTIVDNHLTEAVFTLNGVKNYLGVFSSILHDPTSPQIGDLMGAFSSAEFDCVNVNETVSITGGYSTLTRANADDPGFVVRNYDYHLQERAATVDFCDNSQINGITISNDLDNHARPFNDTGFPDFYGSWDLGSDEHAGTAQPNDVIFIDSFDW